MTLWSSLWRGREYLSQHDAQQAGCARPEDDQRLPRPAERTVAAQAGPGLPLLGPERLGGLGQVHLRQPIRRAAVGAALDAVSRAETPARIAERRRRAARPGRRFVGEEIDDVHVPREEAVVEDLQVRIQLPVRGALHGPPPGPVAFAALDEGQVERPVFGGEVVGVPQRVPGAAGLLHGTDAADHPPQFPHPEMEPDLQERPEPRSLPVPLPAARYRDQRAQGVQHQQGLGLVRDRQARPELIHHLSERSRASVQHPQQVHESAVPAEPVRERDPPVLGAGVLRRNRLEEQLVHRADVVLAVPEQGGVRRAGEIRMRRQDVRDQRFAEELVNALPRLAHDGVRIEVRLEDAGHVVEQLLLLPLLPERRRCPHADQVLSRAEPHAEPPDEAGEVGPLRPVEGVQLVHHQVAQRAGLVTPPEPLIRGPDQEVVQHLVVREQDVGRLVEQRLPVGDHLLRPHPGRARHPLAVLPDEEPRRDPPPEPRNPVDRLRNPPRLIRRQRVHGVDQDRLDPRLPRLSPAMVEHWVQKTLRLPRPRPGGNDRRAPGLASQPLYRRPLVPVRREPQRRFGKRLPALRRPLERQRNGKVRPLRQVLRRRQEVVHHAGQRGIRRPEPGP